MALSIRDLLTTWRDLEHELDRLATDDERAAIAELVRRYLMAFGPATVADLSQFTILKRSALREVVESMADVVAIAGPDGAQLVDVSDGGPRPEADTAALPPRLLGMWDSVLLAYADRSRVIPDEHRPHVIRRNGDVLPTVVVDGLVRGVWRVSADAIEVRALGSLDDATLHIAYDYRGEHGTFLMVGVRHPSLGLGLHVTPSGTMRHLM